MARSVSESHNWTDEATAVFQDDVIPDRHRVVELDLLTDLDGVFAHRKDEQPPIRVNVNDATVHDPA